MVMYGKAMRKKFTNWSLLDNDAAGVVVVVVKFIPVAVVFSELEELLLVEEDVLASASDCALVRKR